MLLIFPLVGSTQTYYPLPLDNAIWQDELHTSHAGLFWHWYVRYPAGDTIINGYKYRQFLTDDQSFSISLQGDSSSNAYTWYEYAIRQDTQEKKVFVIPFFTNQEYLLYDFSLGIGDSLEGYLITTVDSILVGDGSYRRRIHFGGEFLIEGIGSTNGFIPEVPEYQLSVIHYYLDCMTQGNTTLQYCRYLLPTRAVMFYYGHCTAH